ncbi:hypothetical protein SteCoe_22126 [Stentor coeruleus]|uniref:Uncharacterized protein n=1 Tax=Stentor coeruleus TaxID=5963 RepID=A0A1R2BMW8_9CILI|nr:hypothetical protein SteCoe_23399 [Stentor coeruleus]OMJ78112.1 hypothetical protein SteCoe_22126 [Stentor coeruleus]
MEEFFKKVSSELEEYSKMLGVEIESDHKKLISQGYDCMSSCFLRPESIAKCGKCAENCHLTVRRAQNEIEEKVTAIQNRFSDCINTCGIKSARYQSELLKQCLSECSLEASNMFLVVTKDAKQLIKDNLI